MGLFSRKQKTAVMSQTKPGKVEIAKDKEADKSVSMKDLYSETKAVSALSKTEKKVKGEKKYGRAHLILVKPLITEKAANVGAFNKYVFMIDRKANKIEVAKAIEEVYGIKPVKVNILRVSGKKVRYGRTFGERKDWKKAVVTLPSGKTINIYEGV